MLQSEIQDLHESYEVKFHVTVEKRDRWGVTDDEPQETFVSVNVNANSYVEAVHSVQEALNELANSDNLGVLRRQYDDEDY